MNLKYYTVFICVMGTFGDSFAKETVTMHSLSRQCLKVWRMMSDLVEQDKVKVSLEGNEAILHDSLDAMLCALVKTRDMIVHMSIEQPVDRTIAEYIESSLDCIESYSYDLLEQYPGSWSEVIQNQVIRAQEVYAHTVLFLPTR